MLRSGFVERLMPAARSCARAIQETDDLLRGAGFAESRKDSRDAIYMGVGVHVRHRIDSKRNIEAEFMRVTRRRFDADACRDASDDDLRDAKLLEMRVEIGIGEGTPSPLSDRVIG